MFLPLVGEKFEETINQMIDVRGLILDIRGNRGGMLEIGELIASKLVQKPTLFYVFRYRDRKEEVIVQPDDICYTGPVVILVDDQCASACERFAACFQSIDRGIVIGERTRGTVGPSKVMVLPNGVSFQYLTSQSLTPDGIVLEGRGVIPDIAVNLTREDLLDGKDAPIETAIEYILREQKNHNNKQ